MLTGGFLHCMRRTCRIWLRLEGPRPSNKSSLETISAELVLSIAEYLTPEAKAALALAGHTMLSRLGSRVFKLDSASRYGLFLLLDKGGMFLPDILCPFCRIFHAPFSRPSWSWEFYRSMRACHTYVPWERQQAISPYLSSTGELQYCRRGGEMPSSTLWLSRPKRWPPVTKSNRETAQSKPTTTFGLLMGTCS